MISSILPANRWFIINEHTLSGDPRVQIAYYNKAIEWDPTDWTSYFRRGWCQYLLGNYPKAIADLQETIRLFPEYESAYFNLGLAYRDSGQPEMMQRCFDESRRLRLSKEVL